VFHLACDPERETVVVVAGQLAGSIHSMSSGAFSPPWLPQVNYCPVAAVLLPLNCFQRRPRP
jgi:hypothetical protein